MTKSTRTLITYARWSPTPFDTRGLGPRELGSYLVAPCLFHGQGQGSVLDDCNFEAQTAFLLARGATVETHRMSHWAYWFKVTLVKPDNAGRKALRELQESLDSYPVISDDAYSNACFDAACDAWDDYGAKENANEIAAVHGLSEAARDLLDLVAQWRWQYTVENSCEPYMDAPGCMAVDTQCIPDRDTVARMLRTARLKSREVSK